MRRGSTAQGAAHDIDLLLGQSRHLEDELIDELGIVKNFLLRRALRVFVNTVVRILDGKYADAESGP